MSDASKPLDRLRDCAIFPVRHHSPRTSAAVRAFLDAVQPTVVMVEEPSDAAAVIPHLFDADTVPPIAILGYRTDGPPQSGLWPMASYSPEYVAMQWAHERGVRIVPIDIACAERMAYDARARPDASAPDDEGEEPDDDDDDDAVADPAHDDLAHDEALARAHGFRSFDELWEAWFEAPAFDHGDFRRALLAYCELIKPRRGFHELDRARDARMARHILAELDRGTPADAIGVVVGGAHAAALLSGDVDLALDALVTDTVPTAVTIIPYSFTRLAAQVGYGAGNRAPRYYQRAHDRGCDYTRATLEILIELTEHLRLRGFAASLADTIEAYRLAVALTGMRGKSAPGLDEIRDAAIAALCRGDVRHVDGFLWPTVIGKTVGRVGTRIGQNSLQQEFWDQVKARGLPGSDESESFTLKLGDAVQVETSVFLHRLRIADIPYATYRGSQAIAGMGRGAGSDDDPGGVDALARVREHWEAQWTPSTDVALVERIVQGDSLRQVTERRLGEQLGKAATTADAAHVLLEAVVARATEIVGEALAATERKAAVDDELASLARAARALSGLISYGSSRGTDGAAADVLVALCEKTFIRAVLQVEHACQGDDEAVAPARQAMRILHELAMAQPLVDRELWLTTAHALATSDRVHPACAGLLAGLLHLAERLGEAELVALVSFRLSSAADPRAGAAFLEGVLGANPMVMVKNRAVVAALDGFVQGIDADHFRDIVPLLRRAFAGLGATRRHYLLENLLAVRKIGEHARAAAQVLAAKDVDKLKDLSAELAASMDDLDDLL